MKVVYECDLDARYDARASFYGKAKVRELEDGTRQLYSYGTLVAEIKTIGLGKTVPLIARVPYVYGTYSMTTLRHIKEFLKQHGFRAISKTQIEKDYMRER